MSRVYLSGVLTFLLFLLTATTSAKEAVPKADLQQSENTISHSREKPLETHPKSQDEPARHVIDVENHSVLHYELKVRKGTARIEFEINDKVVEVLFPADEDGWIQGSLVLPEGVSKVVMYHYATGWDFEHVYWANLSGGVCQYSGQVFLG